MNKPLPQPLALDDSMASALEVQRLKTELQERDDLLALAAHELRNPLHALSLQLALARTGADAQGHAEIAQRIANAQRTLARYADRVTVLMDLARLNADAYPLNERRIDLAELLRTLMESLQPEAQFRGVTLRAELPAQFVADTDATVLEQIVLNLLLNAFKHANCQTVTLALRVREGGVDIVVADDGRGIDPADRERIFGKFGIAQNSLRGSGTGLGLWIVRKLIGVLGGDITLHGQPGEGSVFTLRLPLADSSRMLLDPSSL